jgi:two-component system sensor histidine kinase PilS (NtrC family)
MRLVSGRSATKRSGLRTERGIPSTRWLLQWVYLGRVTVGIVVFVAAALSFRAIPPEYIVALAMAALTAVLVTAPSVWHTHIRNVRPGMTFLYAQALFDLALITLVVHVTGGPASQFPALYVLVIAVSAILMPLASSLLITSLASLLYLADIVWQPEALSVAVWLQIAVFVAVFIGTGLIASRVRVMGAERDTLQQEVRRLRLEAADILRNIRSGVLTVDGDGHVVYANPSARQLLDLPNEQLLGRSLEQLLGDRAQDLLRVIAATRVGPQKALRSEGQVTTGDRSFPIGMTMTRIDPPSDHELPSVTAIFSDISDQKRVEALNIRTGRLEAVAELSASLAHEIRNPLASIRSSIEQLTQSTGQNEDEQFLAQLVLRESDRLNRLLSEFLDFSRVHVTNCKTLDLGNVAERAVQMVRQHPDCPSDAQIELARSPASVEGDEDLLHRVVVNLVLNALQASNGKARVALEVREARLSDLPFGVSIDSAVLLQVEDDGPGVPADLKDRLFEPFVSGREGGSGLGLAIVQRAVEAHLGVVFVDSPAAGGTVFRVIIPSTRSSEVAV